MATVTGAVEVLSRFPEAFSKLTWKGLTTPFVVPKGVVELGWEEKEVEAVPEELSPPHADTSIAMSMEIDNSEIRLNIRIFTKRESQKSASRPMDE